MIKRLLLCLALLASANAAEIRPSGGAINRARISYEATYDPDAQDFFTRVEANAGTISTPTRVAVNARVLAAKAHGIWPKWARKNLFCGDQLAAALVPLKAVGGNATDTNTNFVEGDYSEATGLRSGTGNEYLNTGLLANALTANSTSFAIYDRTAGATGGGGNGANSANNAFAFFAPFSSGSNLSDQYLGAGGLGRLSVASTAAGLRLATRVSATDHQIYLNGSSIASNATSEGSLPAIVLYIFARNNAGVADSFNTRTFASYAIGSGLTVAEAALDYTDEQAFQTALGRAVAP